MCINLDFCKSQPTYRGGPLFINENSDSINPKALRIILHKAWFDVQENGNETMALQPFDLLCPRKWNSKNRFHCMKESHNHVYPVVIPLLLMWLMYWEGEDRRRRLCDFPAVRMECLALAVLALDSFFTPARTANLSSFNQSASSLVIFGFLSLTGLSFHHSSFSLHFVSWLSSPQRSHLPLFPGLHFHANVTAMCGKWS